MWAPRQKGLRIVKAQAHQLSASSEVGVQTTPTSREQDRSSDCLWAV